MFGATQFDVLKLATFDAGTWPPRILLLAALAIFVLATLAIARARTTVNPVRPDAASSLVVSGIYRFTRNPMYLAFLLILLVLGLRLGNVGALLIALTFVAYMNRFQIEPEERALRRRFGEAFEDYQARVRRWI